MTIEYLPDNPDYSRIQGLDRSAFGFMSLIILIFPLVSFVGIIGEFIKGIKGISLLETGILTTGQLVSKKATNMEVNDRTVYELTFSYEDEYGQIYTVVEKTTQPHVLEDQPEEWLLYSPKKPSRALMLDTLPGAPKFNAQGQILPTPLLGTILILICPFSALVMGIINFARAYLL